MEEPIEIKTENVYRAILQSSKKEIEPEELKKEIAFFNDINYLYPFDKSISKLSLYCSEESFPTDVIQFLDWHLYRLCLELMMCNKSDRFRYNIEHSVEKFNNPALKEHVIKLLNSDRYKCLKIVINNYKKLYWKGSNKERKQAIKLITNADNELQELKNKRIKELSYGIILLVVIVLTVLLIDNLFAILCIITGIVNVLVYMVR